MPSNRPSDPTKWTRVPVDKHRPRASLHLLAPAMMCSREYREQVVADSRKGVIVQLGNWEMNNRLSQNLFC